MKKSIAVFAVACAAYGTTLLATGIFILRFNLSELFAEMLVEKLNIIGLFIVIGLYLPVLLMRFIPVCFIIYGAGYLLFFARTLYKLYKRNIPWLYKNLRILCYVHACLFILIFIADLIIVAYIIRNIQNGFPVALTVFTVLFNLTAILFEITDIIAVKKLKQNATCGASV